MSAVRIHGLLWIVGLVGGLGLTVSAFPVDVLASSLLVIVVLALCAAVAVGAKSATGSLMKWAVALVLVASGWPAVSARVRQGLTVAFEERLGADLHGARPASGGLDGFLFDLTTCLLVVGLMLLAAGVLLVSSRIRAGLRPRPVPPRPQARRRGRLVAPTHADQGQTDGDDPADDDFGLLGGVDGR